MCGIAPSPPDECPDDHADAPARVSLLGGVCIAFVQLYQKTLSPLIGQHCRFRPTCSQYMIGAIRKYGAIRGVPRGIWRIMRCNPWGGAGLDPP